MKNYVIITGAYGGLGTALARNFASAGYKLILLGRNREKLDLIHSELEKKTEVISLVADVGNWESCKNAYAAISKMGVKVQVLINNAGITYIKRFDEHFEIEQYQNVINTNLNGPVYMSYLFFNDLLKNKGSLINVSSVLGYAPMIGRSAYAASKYGLDGFSHVLSAETLDKIHLMMVYPTFFNSGIRKTKDKGKTVNEILSTEEVSQRIFKAFLKRKRKLFIGKTARISYFLNKFSPSLFEYLMLKKAGKVE